MLTLLVCIKGKICKPKCKKFFFLVPFYNAKSAFQYNELLFLGGLTISHLTARYK